MKKNIIKFLLLSSTIFLFTGCDNTVASNTTTDSSTIVVTTEAPTIPSTKATTEGLTSENVPVTSAAEVPTTEVSTTEVTTTVVSTTEASTVEVLTTEVPTTVAPTTAKAHSDAYNAIPAEYRKIATTKWTADHENKISITLDDDGIFHIALTSSYPDLGYDWSTSGTATWSNEYQGLYCTDYTERSYDYKTKQTDIIAENGTAELYLVDGTLTISVHHGHIMTSSYMFYPQ